MPKIVRLAMEDYNVTMSLSWIAAIRIIKLSNAVVMDSDN